MNLYGNDLSFLDFGFIDPTIVDSASRTPRLISSSSAASVTFGDGKPPATPKKTSSPPKHRHDGTSPLPLGMDWSLPPRRWDGRDSVWPHDPHTGWSYCVTVPSWIIAPKSRSSDSVVFYRVQVAIQSPEGITSTRGVLRRFNDFLKLFSELKKAFPSKNLPPAPPKSLLRMKNRMLLEERRCSLEDWMEKLLSDIDLSRSAPVAIFLELEAAARSSFYDSNQQVSDANSSASSMVLSYQFQTNSDAYLIGGNSSIASDYDNSSTYETSELGTPRHGTDNHSELGMDNASDKELAGSTEATIMDGMSGSANGQLMGGLIQSNQERFSKQKMHPKKENSPVDRDTINESTFKAALPNKKDMELFYESDNSKLRSHVRRLSNESLGSDVSSLRASEISNIGVANSGVENSADIPEGVEASRTTDFTGLGLQLPTDLLVALPSDERHKMNRVLATMKQRLATAKTDMEDLIARLNQELAVRQYLTTKVKDLEVELETTKQSGKENLQQAILIERERFTQMQWDMEELRRKRMEMEVKLKSEQDEKVQMETAKASIVEENEMLQKELDVAREQLETLHKYFEELELKSKADVKLLVKEVKSLRSSQSDLKQDLGRLMKEKLELERVMHKERQRWEHTNAANAKLLHECEILRNRLEECSVNFLIEEEDKLIMDTASPSDALDLLTTSDNRIGLLLAEAQLLAQEVENTVAVIPDNTDGHVRTTDDDLRKIVTDIFIDNAKLRKQVNSVIRCTVNTSDKSGEDDEEKEVLPRKTVLSKFLERRID